MDNETRRSKGIASVESASIDCSISLEALALNDTELGNKIRIELAEAEKNRAAASSSSLAKGNPDALLLYVGSLHFNITEENLRGIFEHFGKIERIELIKDTETGQSKGYGFISFYDSEDAKKALEKMNGFDLAVIGRSQFRAKLAEGYHEREFGIKAEWHFFATANGKGVCDDLAETANNSLK